MWWSWTAPSDERVTIDTIGSSDPYAALAVYTGDSISNLSLVASNYGGWVNRVEFDAVSGQTYAIAFDSYSFGGNVTLNLTLPPANDNRASAQVIPSSLLAETPGTLSGATDEPGESALSMDAIFDTEPTVWYTWTAPANAEWLRLRLAGIGVPSVLTVFPSGSDLPIVQERTASPNELIFAITGGTSYEIRPSVHVRDLYSVFTPPVLDFTLELEAVATPSTPDDFVFRGRGKLALGSAAGFSGALADFTEALNLDSSHEKARFFRGLARLLSLTDEAAFAQLQTDLGVTLGGSLRDGSVTAAVDADSHFVPAAGAHTSQVVAWIDDHFIPRLEEIRTDFGLITDSAFLVSLSAYETGGSPLLVDRADVLSLTATTHAVEMLFDLLFTYDLGVSLESARTLAKSGELSAEKTFETYQNLLTFADSGRLQDFAGQLSLLRDQYEIASTAVLARSEQQSHLTSGLGNSPEGATEIQEHLDLVDSSLTGEVNWQGHPINLSRLLATNDSIRDWLPDISGNGAVPGSLPDPTFDGILPGISQADANNVLARLGVLAGMEEYQLGWVSYFDSLGLPSGPFDDADGDGISNFDEYVLLSDPEIPDTVYQSLDRAEIDPGQSELTFTFIRPIAELAGEWPLVLAVSDDLSTWDLTESKVQLISVEPSGDSYSEVVTYQVTGIDPAQASNRYFRIQAVYTP